MQVKVGLRFYLSQTVITIQIHHVQYKIQSLNDKNGELHNYGKFFHFLGSSVLVLVAQISVSNRFYGCVDFKNANQTAKKPYFECFQAILYLSFIRYQPVE